VCFRFEITVVDTVWIKGEENVLCDALSRFYALEGPLDVGHYYRDPANFSEWGLTDVDPRRTLLGLCDPAIADDPSMGGTINSWKTISALLDQLGARSVAGVARSGVVS
jgi:hypothetical protein